MPLCASVYLCLGWLVVAKPKLAVVISRYWKNLWSPVGKGLTSWLSFVVYNCEFITFPLVYWVRCGT